MHIKVIIITLDDISVGDNKNNKVFLQLKINKSIKITEI